MRLTEAEQMAGDNLVDIVCSYFAVPRVDVMGDSRRAQFAEPRAVVYVVLRRAGWTLESIGDFVQRDHGTVSVVSRRTEKRMECDWTLRLSVADIERTWKSVSGPYGSTIAHLRKAVDEIHGVVREARVVLQDLEREADSLLNKIAQVERFVA